MSENPPPLTTESPEHRRLTAELIARWPEHRIGPGLARVAAACELLGDPQRSAPVIHVAGTNGKGSTAAMIDALLRSAGLRTGRFASPHVSDVTERICLDGEPISPDRFAEVWRDVAPYVALVDDRAIDGIAMTFFEVITTMAFAAFADAPVDVMILEVGLGGTHDATNVADAGVAVITPIDLDHTHLLGDTVADIAGEKAGVIKPGAHAVLAGQSREAAEVLLARCAEAGALPLREGVDFGLLSRQVAVGGQVVRLNGVGGPVEDVVLPLHGEHQAHNAALALAAAEAFLGLKGMDPDVVREGFADVVLPGRLEVVRRSPTIVLDGAHNPHGARAAAAAVGEAFGFTPCVGVVAVMADKDAVEVLRAWADVFDSVVLTQAASTSRGLPAEDLAELAREVFDPERIRAVPRLDDAIETAVGLLADEDSPVAGVVITGSVIAVGEARNLLRHSDPDSGATEGPALEIGDGSWG